MTWVLTVASVTNRACEISWLESPWATWSRTLTSRSVSSSKFRRRSLIRRWAANEFSDQPPGDRRCEHRLAGGRGPHRFDELLRSDVFEQETAGADLERLVHVFVSVPSGQDQHSWAAGTGRSDEPAGCLQPVDFRHPHVHEHDIGGE